MNSHFPVGATVRLRDSAINRASNYWFGLLSQDQHITVARVGPDGLWDVVFIGADKIPHLVEGVQPERFLVVYDGPVHPRRWWQFWRR